MCDPLINMVNPTFSCCHVELRRVSQPGGKSVSLLLLMDGWLSRCWDVLRGSQNSAIYHPQATYLDDGIDIRNGDTSPNICHKKSINVKWMS